MGSAQLYGVQIQNGGQLNTMNAPLTFLNLINSSVVSNVVSTSLLNCKANCIYVQNSNNISFTNNVLSEIWTYGAQFVQIKSVTFNNNLIIGVHEPPTLDDGLTLVACVYTHDYINPATSLVSIKNNFCLGSSTDGFALPHIKCT
jgi:hypothetical protein